MSQEPKTGNLVDTTDCLEAVSVIRCWKNFLFIIILLALLLLQGAFWIVNIEQLKSERTAADENISASVSEVNEPALKTTDKIKQAAKKVVQDINALVSGESEQPQQAAEPNEPAQAGIKQWFHPKQNHITAIVRFLNFVLIPGAALYCLTMLFCLKVSLIGRLGGINHITRAFFLSLLFVILLMPWQLIFSPVFAGAMFTPSELINACQVQKTPLAYVSMFLRFTGYWLVVLLLLLLAQIRSMRWARATLRRLEVI
jgi:hypothetical protein